MRFRDISISWKLTLLAVVTTLFSMVAVISTIAIIDRQFSQMAMVENYLTIADIAGQVCLPALEHADDNEADRALSSLRKDRQIVLASLYNSDGKPCATTPDNVSAAPALEWADAQNGSFSSDGYLHILRPIRRDKSRFGHLYLKVSVDKLTSRWWDWFVVAMSVVCLSILMAIALAGRLQRFISGPVLHLVNTAHHITKSGDFSVRAAKETGDELGELVDEFNGMLTTIEARDAALEGHQENLERIVKERTNELEKKTHEAEAASVAKSVFLANMSHEIRTPMNAIIGFANMLRKGNYDNEEERTEFLNIICSSGEHLLGLISNILDLSKIEAGCMTMEHIPVSPQQLISDVVSIMRVNALTKGLGLDYTWIGPIPRRVMTDPAKLRQLLINLIGNAIKFTERGGVHVVARLGMNQRTLQVQVIDSGIGIPADKQSLIFSPFSQADASVTRRFGGTGLGLSISRKIAEALGGTLDVESEPGVGSTFTATISTGDIGEIDNTPVPPVCDVIPAADPSQCDSIGPIPKGCRVLLVEDGDTNRRLIHKMLERHGFEVTDAVNGQVGVDLATTHEFDVILMDMQMPIKDGYTAARELRTKGLRIPIVALTAHAMTGDAEKCRNAGCSDYLSKPIQENRLLGKLSELMRGRGVTGAPRPISNAFVADLAGKLKPKPADLEADESHVLFSEKPDEPGDLSDLSLVNIACALDLNDDIFREIVQEFSEKVQSQIERMKLALAADDWNELVELAHWLKGSGGTAGYEQFTIPAGRLERLAKQHKRDKVEAVLNEIDRISHAVANEMSALPTHS